MAGRRGRTRLIGIVPEYVGFIPEGIPTGDIVELTLDELEAIRLLDLEKMSQEETAACMGVARTTVTSIYERARTKVADCLVNGKELLVEGGNVAFRPDAMSDCSTVSIPKKRENLMRVAVTYENGSIFQHFGRTQSFKLYDVEDGTITSTQVVGTQGAGHGALTGFLKGNNVDVLICGGIGGGAQSALARQGIELYGGLSGLADDVVNRLVAGELEKTNVPICDHHGHGHAHGHGRSGECGHSHGNELYSDEG